MLFYVLLINCNFDLINDMRSFFSLFCVSGIVIVCILYDTHSFWLCDAKRGRKILMFFEKD